MQNVQLRNGKFVKLRQMVMLERKEQISVGGWVLFSDERSISSLEISNHRLKWNILCGVLIEKCDNLNLDCEIERFSMKINGKNSALNF